MSDFARARLNMVESQLRPNGVRDPRIVTAMLELPREAFVPASMRALAYMDQELPLRPGTAAVPARHLMAPLPLARLVQLASVGVGDIVLDVGCATGYSAAVLARLAESVVALECDGDLAESASATLEEQGVDTAVVVTGPLQEGYPSEGPYDAIVLGGAVPEVPPSLLEQLKPRGRLAAIVFEEGVGRAYRYERVGSGFGRGSAFEAGAPPLPGFERVAAFEF